MEVGTKRKYNSVLLSTVQGQIWRHRSNSRVRNLSDIFSSWT